MTVGAMWRSAYDSGIKIIISDDDSTTLVSSCVVFEIQYSCKDKKKKKISLFRYSVPFVDYILDSDELD